MMAPLMNHVWQSTLVAILIAILALALRSAPARVRFCLWMAASLKFLIPFAILVNIGSHLSWNNSAAVPPAAFAIVAHPFQLADPGFVPPMPGGPMVPTADDPLPMAAAVWLCGFLGVSAYWIRGLCRVRSAMRNASRAPESVTAFPIPVLLTGSSVEPGVFGIFRPVLLLPRGIVRYLDDTQLQAIAAHECCHLRRRDNLWSAIQMLVEAVLWFHPLVWWLGGRMLAERERACDEAVLGSGTEPEVYAQSILQVCRYYTSIPLPCVSGISGSNLKKRIVAIIDYRIETNLSRAARWVLVFLGVCALTLPLAAGAIYQRQAPEASSRTFDAISIRPTETRADGSFWMGMDRNAQDPTTTNIHNFTLKNLVCFAYVEDQSACNFKLVIKGPGWAETDRFVIVARTEAPASPKEKRQMLQAALVDRFHLVLRRETQSLAGYLMEVAGHGPKLKPAVKTDTCAEDFKRYDSHVMVARDDKITADCLSIDEIANAIQTTVIGDHPVFNKTDLPAANLYQLNLEVAFPLSNSQALGPSVFSALPNQLGLRLRAGKAPMEVLVVESAERPKLD